MRASRGFTLPELLIVVTIMVILLGAGLPSFTEFVRSQRVKTVSFDLFSTLVHARNEAVTRNASVTVAPVSGSWANGWTVSYTDSGGNTVALRTQDPVTNVTIDASLDTIVYRGSGRLTPSATPATFELSTAGDAPAVRCISIDPSGRPHTKVSTC
jgi:type IV fimbrial biogenesis protein FimT